MTETPNPNIVDADTLTGEMRPIRRAVVALGSNLGERLTSLQGAVHALADTPDVWLTGVSPIYETEPVDAPAGSETFLNAVVLLDTTLAFTPFVEGGFAPFPAAELPRLRDLGDRVLFGTDFPNIQHSYPDALEALERAGLGAAWLRAVCHDNAARLFGR